MTSPTPTIPNATKGISYTDLYARWEKGHWLATEIDFTQDKIDWDERMTPEQKRTAMWFFSLFFHGEDHVTDELSPYIAAAPTEEQTYFLTTQQVDEARHSVFFNRFFHEVVGLGDGTSGSGLEATRHELTWGHTEMFAQLARVADQLRTDHSPAMYARALTNYHIIVEGTLAQPGQHFLEEWLERVDLLPGFREGMGHVALDEQRHIAFGVKALSELYAADPGPIGDAIVGAFSDSANAITGFAYPNGGDRSTIAALDYGLDHLFAESIRSIQNRLRGIGLPKELRARVSPLDLGVDSVEFSQAAIKLLDAGYLGQGRAVKSHAVDDIDTYFGMLHTVPNVVKMPSGSILQFAFTDIEPRYVKFENGTAQVVTGTHRSPTTTLTISFDNFVDLGGGRVNPVKLFFQRKLKLHGDRSMLIGPKSLFATPVSEGNLPQPQGPVARMRQLIGAS